jgi:hypothetical protein
MRTPRWHLLLGGLVASVGFALRMAAGSMADTLARFDEALLALDDDPALAGLRQAA